MSVDADPVKYRISYDPALPITGRITELVNLVRNHQVIIVAGETGSGKTTQLPKICLQAGRKKIAHTQPRRIAARTVAARIADELEVSFGDVVGYQVRFTRQTSKNTQIKVMTDGILLSELANDRRLSNYDTIIIDEAHERSLNIDFLLGYLKRLLIERPDLKVIVTSATIDTDKFSKHFDNAPIVEVSGRSYPVEIRYQPLAERDQIEGVRDAVTELVTEPGGGDILVFLSGEREIKDCAETISGLNLDLEVLPLYARLSFAEQNKVFQPHNKQRVVLATNVAETSITVPGIRYVIDCGNARISRYSARTKVQRLPIESISQASANQRSGRCGRLGPGVAIRLYNEEDFSSRSEFTDAEILRTNLATVILQMIRVGLGDIAEFPFVDQPPKSQISDGIKLLKELGALNKNKKSKQLRLTRVGHLLAQLPVDPRLGRMLIEANNRGCLREVLIIVSALAIPDVRERPSEFTEQADTMHRRFFADVVETPVNNSDVPLRHTVHTGTRKTDTVNKTISKSGDFGAILRLWSYLRNKRKELSGNAFRRMCRDEYLHFLRIREWEDLHGQLKKVCRELKFSRNKNPAEETEVLACILSGLLGHIGLAEVREPKKKLTNKRRGPKEYLGAHSTRFVIQPGSALQRNPPPMVMAFELVETSRLWARTVAEVTAEQVEAVGKHILRTSVSSPYWSQRTGRVQAKERVSLYGVPIISERLVDFSVKNPQAAREIFIRQALVAGEWQTKHEFFANNQKLRAEVVELEDRIRRRDLVVEDQIIFDFYAERIPANVFSSNTFDRWWRNSDHSILNLSKADLMARDVDSSDFPDRWCIADKEFAISYIFDPGSGYDGVNVTIPISALNQLSSAPFTWQVSGLRAELAAELIRTLPKNIRKKFIPANEYGLKALSWLRQNQINFSKDFCYELGTALYSLTGEDIPKESWQPEKVDSHLKVNFIITEKGKQLTRGKDLDELREKLAPRLTKKLNKVVKRSATGATDWNFDKLPEQIVTQNNGEKLVGYPALIDEGGSVGVIVTDSPKRQKQLHEKGLRRLLTLTNPDPTRWVISHLGYNDKVALGDSSYPSVPDLLADARLKTVDRLARKVGGVVRDEKEYRRLANSVRISSADEMLIVTKQAAKILIAQANVKKLIDTWAFDEIIKSDVSEQLENLTFNKFISATPDPWYDRLDIYLKGIEIRLNNARIDLNKDSQKAEQIAEVEDEYNELVNSQPPGELEPDVEQIAFLIEEFRISLFAQKLKTALPISAKRIREAIKRVELKN